MNGIQKNTVFMEKIRKAISGFSSWDAFSASDFFGMCGSHEMISKALCRLEKDGFIRRAIRGIYYRPNFNKYLQSLTVPSIQGVASALARKNSWTIVPCGNMALNLIGLSTQIPAGYVYMSDGPGRTYRIENNVLKFRHCAGKLMKCQSEFSMLVGFALKTLGHRHADKGAANFLKRSLSPEQKRDIETDIAFFPKWMQSFLRHVCDMPDNPPSRGL